MTYKQAVKELKLLVDELPDDLSTLDDTQEVEADMRLIYIAEAFYKVLVEDEMFYSRLKKKELEQANKERVNRIRKKRGGAYE